MATAIPLGNTFHMQYAFSAITKCGTFHGNLSQKI